MASSGQEARYCRCGARLARDNDAALCRMCQLGGLVRPPRPPEEFWATEAFGDAFAARHIGRVLTAYRRHPWHGRKGVSQAQLAEWLQTSQPQVSRAETGPPIRDLGTLGRWAQVLGMPPDRLWFALAGPNGSVGVAFSYVPAEAVASDIPAIRAMSGAFRTADRQVGAGGLYRTVERYLRDEVGPHLTGARGHRDSAVAFAAAASLTEMLGWMAHDCGDDAAAAEHFAQALRLAAMTDDFALEANILASMSHLADALGRAGEAVGRAEAGLRLLTHAGCSAVMARLHGLEARGHAALGDSAGCRAALRQAEEALCRSEADPSPWASPFDEASLAGEAATAMRALGQLSDAARHAGRVLELRGPDRARSRALGQLCAAAIHLDRGEVDAAALLGTEVLAGARGVRSARVRRQIAHLARSLRPYRRSAAPARFLFAMRQQEAGLLAPVLSEMGGL